MDFEEIAKKAYKEENIDDCSDLPIKYTYLKLKDLYFNYKIGKIDKEKSIVMKNKIKKDYELNRREYDDVISIYKMYNFTRIHNELLLDYLEKTKDKEEALGYSLKIIANCINDSSFEDRIKQKLGLN